LMQIASFDSSDILSFPFFAIVLLLNEEILGKDPSFFPLDKRK
jgi:hypothetical protein